MGTHPLERADAQDSKQPSAAEAVERKQIPLYEHDRPHKLDGTVAMAVLLRRIYEKTHIDSNLTGEARQAKVIFAADDATELVKELVLVASLDKENWNEVRNELAHAVRGIGHLESEARRARRPDSRRGARDLRTANASDEMAPTDLRRSVRPPEHGAARASVGRGSPGYAGR
ncbi:MAG: hypothetical protein H0X17_02415 [Deltaproteobacteria bacterium]|nr:hypothetical protein [Deltaproteobacteria bacterium]